MSDPRWRWAGLATWALPVYGALTLTGTVSRQPDPDTRFAAWSEYVTTDWFYASHIGASILGLAVGTLGVVGLGVTLAGGSRPRAALTAMVLHLFGAAIVFALFGVAAFVQPAIGHAFLDGDAAARGWHDDVFNNPRTLVPAAVGLLLFSAASILMAWSLADRPRIPRWTAWAYGLTGPFIGILGVMVSVLQPVGSTLLILSGALIAGRLTRPEATSAGPAPSIETNVGRQRRSELRRQPGGRATSFSSGRRRSSTGAPAPNATCTVIATGDTAGVK